MAYNRVQAARLLSTSEKEVFMASLAEQVASLAAPRLRVMVRRARNLRDKHRDLLRRQRLETRRRTGTKHGRSGSANQRTAKKAQVFAEVLQRFEKRLARIDAAQAHSRRSGQLPPAAGEETRSRRREGRCAATHVRPKAPAKGPSRSGSPLGPTSESARAARHAMQFEAAGSRAIQGHVSSQVRRNQAKRDGRR